MRGRFLGAVPNDVSIIGGAEGADNLCDLLVFVQQPSGAITPPDPELLEVDH
jgi:hypothetical protein